MKKKALFLLVLAVMGIFLISSVSALDVEVVDRGSVVISELDNPAVYNFVINSLTNDNIEIYSFVGLTFSPRGAFDVASGSSTIEVKAYPNMELRDKEGLYNLEYYISGRSSGIYKGNLNFRVVPLEEVFELSAEDVELRDEDVVIKLKNTQNTNVVNVRIRFISQFFDTEEEVSFKSYEQVNVTIPIDINRKAGLLAGSYVIKAELQVEGVEAGIEGTVRYIEKENIKTERKTEGIIVRKTTITKNNEGNVPSIAQIEVKKTIIGRLFTISSLEPTSTQRSGLLVEYIWEKDLQPGESYSITTTTNYTMPLIFVLLVIIIAFLVKNYSATSLNLVKRVSFVRTKGGEFALKVTLRVKAKKYTENIQVIDRLPGMTQLYEKFGTKPDKIESSTRRLFWNIDRLNAGEERVYSYVVYSKVKVIGRFELPSATAIYQREGKTEEAFSNRTFFVAGTARGE